MTVYLAKVWEVTRFDCDGRSVLKLWIDNKDPNWLVVRNLCPNAEMLVGQTIQLGNGRVICGDLQIGQLYGTDQISLCDEAINKVIARATSKLKKK